MSERVRIVWPDDAPVWDFEASLMDAPASAGLVLRDVFFCGHRVLWKASLPVVLGKTFPEKVYRLDLFGNQAWQQKSRFGTEHIHVDWALFGDEVVLEVAAGFACDLGFRAYQRYYLRGDGRISARLWVGSEGPPPSFADHVGFFRFDLDIDGGPADRVSQFDLDGDVWTETILPTEIAVHRRRGKRVFRQIDTVQKKGYWILPGPRDGSTDEIIDSIAKHDLWFLRYHPSEDRDGREAGDDDAWLDAQLGNELMMKHDIVTWYTVRVPSPVHGWIERWSPPVGPDLFPHEWWPPASGVPAASPGGGGHTVTIPPLPLLEGRIKHWRSTPWLLHEKGADTFEIDLPPGASWAAVKLEDDGLWGDFKVTERPNEGDTGRVRLVIEWHRPLWGHVEYRYTILAHRAFVTNTANTVSLDAEKDVRPYSERLGPNLAGGADFTSDWRVKSWGDDF